MTRATRLTCASYILLHCSDLNIEKNRKFAYHLRNNAKKKVGVVQKCVDLVDLVDLVKSFQTLLAKIGLDTAENEPSKVWLPACL